MIRVLATVAAVLLLAACGKSEPKEASAQTTAAAGGAIDLHDAGPPGDPAAGKAVYDKTCTACHQADGTGMGGTLAANFKADASRLAKPDSELLKSIAEGKQGKVGVMPPQKGVLSDQEMKDALAYIRQEFGSAK